MQAATAGRSWNSQISRDVPIARRPGRPWPNAFVSSMEKGKCSLFVPRRILSSNRIYEIFVSAGISHHACGSGGWAQMLVISRPGRGDAGLIYDGERDIGMAATHF